METWGLNPVVLEPKELRSWNNIGNVDFKRHMIRSGLGEGGKGSIREHFIPNQVDENPIQRF
jgi:hypothetical protein